MKSPLALFILGSLTWADRPPVIPDCHQNHKGPCTIELSQIHPTQACAGFLQIQAEVKYFSAMDSAKFESYLAKNPLPLVWGPQSQAYLVDHHHLSLSLMKMGRTKALATVIADLPDSKQFWTRMNQEHWDYLLDCQGQPLDPSQLPLSLSQIQDDPMRSLAGEAREKGYFQKSEVYYAEFQWANYLRPYFTNIKVSAQNLDSLLQNHRSLFCADSAQKLPGYPGPCH